MTAASRAAGAYRGIRHIFPKRMLFKYGQDFPQMAWCLASGNDAIIRSRPFDGMFLNVTTSGQQVMDQSVNLTQSAVASEIAGWGSLNLGECIYNWGTVRYTQTALPDYWNDTHWTQIAANWQAFAAALKAEGQIIGICFDDEYYGGTVPNPWDWGSLNSGTYGDSGDTNPASAPGSGIDPTHTLAQSRTKVQARGKQVMDAVRAVWPNIRVIFLHGPYVSTVLTSAAFNPPPYNDVAFQNELMGAFFGGMVESTIGTPAVCLDGGEMYQNRSLAENQKVRAWQLRGLSRSSQTVFSSTVANNYRIGAGNGVFDKDFNTSGYPLQSDSAIQNQIVWAMKTSDFAWYYTEYYNWYGPVFPTEHPGVDTAPAHIAAVSAARDLGRR